MSSDDNNFDRRSFLTLAGTASAAALAGCTGGGDGGGDETTTTTTTTEAMTTTETTTAMTETTETTTETDTTTTTTDETTTTTTQEPQEFPVTITQGQPPSTLDPHNHRETPTDNVVRQVYDGILGRDRAGKIIDELATEYRRQREGWVRFTLRDGVQWHDGDDLTPEDVAYSVNRIVQDDVGIASPQSDQLAGVEESEAVVGTNNVDVRLGSLNPIVFSLFATYCDVMQKEWTQNNDKSYIAQNMNGTGPFKLKSFEPEVEVVLERNENYWQEPASASEVTFRSAAETSTRVNQLLAGETDIIVNVPPQEINRVRSESSTRVAAVPSTRIIYNGMVYNRAPFDSQAFRQAMNYAIDLESIVQNVLQTFGDQTGQPTLEGFFGHNPDINPYPYDPDQAESLVEESGYAGTSIELHTPVGRYLKDVEIAQAVAAQIDELSNVSCEAVQRDFGALAGELIDGKLETGPPLYLIGWGNATFDASQTIIPLLTTNGAVTSYSNQQVDDMMDQAQAEGDPDAREGILQEVNQILHDDAPWIFLNRQYSVYGASNRLDWEARRDEAINAYAIDPA